MKRVAAFLAARAARSSITVTFPSVRRTLRSTSIDGQLQRGTVHSLPTLQLTIIGAGAIGGKLLGAGGGGLRADDPALGTDQIVGERPARVAAPLLGELPQDSVEDHGQEVVDGRFSKRSGAMNRVRPDGFKWRQGGVRTQSGRERPCRLGRLDLCEIFAQDIQFCT